MVYDKVLSKGKENNSDSVEFDTTKSAIHGSSNVTCVPYTGNDTAESGLSIIIGENNRSAIITIDWSNYSETIQETAFYYERWNC